MYIYTCKRDCVQLCRFVFNEEHKSASTKLRSVQFQLLLSTGLCYGMTCAILPGLAQLHLFIIRGFYNST